ncbi:hypothetical protein MES4922_380023 [Mesorhizobium ventifaucium]|uniref:Transposase n=1 Tax=Mesorhizobium ventifaucium TaxID=666020 RepID=A0ABN8K3Q8_9HYPH|nr:hypothetical protein MES4922_380023 [Mesorhizobium ventifaucium]
MYRAKNFSSGLSNAGKSTHVGRGNECHAVERTRKLPLKGLEDAKWTEAIGRLPNR